MHSGRLVVSVSCYDAEAVVSGEFGPDSKARDSGNFFENFEQLLFVKWPFAVNYFQAQF